MCCRHPSHAFTAWEMQPVPKHCTLLPLQGKEKPFKLQGHGLFSGQPSKDLFDREQSAEVAKDSWIPGFLQHAGQNRPSAWSVQHVTPELQFSQTPSTLASQPQAQGCYRSKASQKNRNNFKKYMSGGILLLGSRLIPK